ncbi:hypothetical protein [Flavobacterium muglaense]|uniref:Uncharacterized protein n=1 Tax=Flavobacterium muglaense TaxID=2764716 RepID=A0A923MWT7_9FLAO|nr:hypothetical protein [Flavobacterium muglaense]MBC5836533.1 hypothetical protein [Flavobacterium muglaense]MBC5843201.1 hypothetical protein [Flavobacterium muglaense]
MFLTKDQIHSVLNNGNENIKNELLEKSKFLFNLLQDDDWSFVIKSHSLIESLITELIINRINQIELKKTIERMPLHNDTVSKMEIVKIYELLSTEERSFIKNLTEIRNEIVHKYENINFTFENYINRFSDKNKRERWRKVHLWESMSKETKKEIEKNIYANPKFGVWLALLTFVFNTHEKITIIKSGKITQEIATKNSKIIVDDWLSKE